jgi:hypothetical protein
MKIIMYNYVTRNIDVAIMVFDNTSTLTHVLYDSDIYPPIETLVEMMTKIEEVVWMGTCSQDRSNG